MQPASSTPIPDGLLAAITLLSENPRLGLKSKNPALHPGHNLPNFTAAIGDSWSVASESRWSHQMGRFLSPDPSALTFADPLNPQSLNLYAYVNNNPLSFVDPTGLDCVYINNDTGNYEGFNSGDCDNSTDAKANSGYYFNGSVSTIYTSTGDAQGQVTGFAGTSDDTGAYTISNNPAGVQPGQNSGAPVYGQIVADAFGSGPDAASKQAYMNRMIANGSIIGLTFLHSRETLQGLSTLDSIRKCQPSRSLNH